MGIAGPSSRFRFFVAPRWRTCIVSLALVVNTQAAFSQTPQDQELQALLLATAGKPDASTAPAALPLDTYLSTPRDEPDWPYQAYLSGEVERLRGNHAEARRAFRELSTWSASDSLGGGRGGSGLAAIALWRWLQGLAQEDSPDEDEVRTAVEAAESIAKKRLPQGMVRVGILPALPQIEESIARLTARVVWTTGAHDAALEYFMDYLSVATETELDEFELGLRDRLIESNMATLDRIALYQGTRLRTLRKNEAAAGALLEALESQDPEIRAAAGVQLAELWRFKRKKEAIEILDEVLARSADAELVQEGLHLRARIHQRRGQAAKFLADLQTLLARYPEGPWSDDALYRLGMHYLERKQPDAIEQAEVYFTRLREFEGKNDKLNSAYFFPAIAYVGRGKPDDLAKAAGLLEALLDEVPESPLRTHALFWLGRIAEDTGDGEKARARFAAIVQESPYDYYAIRARMHLNLGPTARTRVLPDDEATVQDLETAYQRSRVDTLVEPRSPYHERVAKAVSSGLYEGALASDLELRLREPSKLLKDIELSQLDEWHLLPALAVLLAIRQDALVAADIDPEADSTMRIAGAAGHELGDWPLATWLLIGRNDSAMRRAAVQRDERYLATSYPPVFREQLLPASQKRRVPPALMYAVMRQESVFYTAAQSSEGALGLFQFMPKVFHDLDKQWGLLARERARTGGATDFASYIIDPQRSIDLWARWAGTRLLKRQNCNLMFVVMDHQGGYGSLDGWKKQWRASGRLHGKGGSCLTKKKGNDDFEYLLEIAGYANTRVFARKVLANVAIVDAAGFLD